MYFQSRRPRAGASVCGRWLVVCLAALLAVGEQAMLRAGPCEDSCAAAKAKDLLKCQTDFDTAMKKCVNGSEAALRVCQTNLQGAIDKADVDLETQMKIAFAGYAMGLLGCAFIVNPICVVGVATAYASALVAVNLNWAKNVEQAAIDKKTCDTNAATDLEKCRKNAADDRAGCEKNAADACDSCIKKCSGG